MLKKTNSSLSGLKLVDLQKTIAKCFFGHHAFLKYMFGWIKFLPWFCFQATGCATMSYFVLNIHRNTIYCNRKKSKPWNLKIKNVLGCKTKIKTTARGLTL